MENHRNLSLKKDEDLHALHEQILSAIPLILIGISSDFRVTHWNAAAERSFGISSENIIGKAFFDCGIDWNWKKIGALVSDFIRDINRTVKEDIHYKRADGKTGYLNIQLNSFGSTCGEDCGILFLADEVTEHKLMENQLSEAQRLRSMGRLAAGVAAELSLPCQSICHNLHFLENCFDHISTILKTGQLLAASARISDDTKREIEKLRQNYSSDDIRFLRRRMSEALGNSLADIEHVVMVAQEMKDFSHPDSEGKEEIDINRAIEGVILVSRSHWKPFAQMRTDFDMKLPRLMLFPDQLNQILLHVIVNAAEAIEHKSKHPQPTKNQITIRTLKSDNNWLEVRIKDTGVGIPAQIYERIFEPFFTTKELGKYAGQGLTICRTLMDRLGGMISFQSKADVGTTFTLHFPLQNKP